MRQKNGKSSHTGEKNRFNFVASVVTGCPGNYPISTAINIYFFVEIG